MIAGRLPVIPLAAPRGWAGFWRRVPGAPILRVESSIVGPGPGLELAELRHKDLHVYTLW